VRYRMVISGDLGWTLTHQTTPISTFWLPFISW